MPIQQNDLFSEGKSYGLSLLTVSPDPVVVCTTNGDIAAVNEAAADLLSMSKALLTQKALLDIIPRHYKSTHKYLVDFSQQPPGNFKIRNKVEVLAKAFIKSNIDVHLNFVRVEDDDYGVIAFRDISEQEKYKKSLEQTERILQNTIENLATGACHLSLGGKFKFVNHRLASFLGIRKRDFLTKTLMDYVVPQDLENILQKFEELLSHERDSLKTQVRFYHAKGHMIWAQLTISMILDDKDKPAYFLAMVEDINSRMLFEKLIRDSELKFRTIVESLSRDAMVCMLSPKTFAAQYVNSGFERIWGLSGDPLYDSIDALLEAVAPEDRERVENYLHHQLLSKQDDEAPLDYRILRHGSEPRYIRQSHYLIEDPEDGSIQQIVIIANDITKDVRHQQQLEQAMDELRIANEKLTILTRTDRLTNVLNRAAIQEEAQRELLRYKRYRFKSTLVFIDLVDFKYVNDQHGHLAGDLALQHCAQHIKSITRNTDFIGRYGGDEFIVLLPNTTLIEAQTVVNKLKQTNLSFYHDAKKIEVGMSIGLSEVCDTMQDEIEWLNTADKLMYEDKQKAKKETS